METAGEAMQRPGIVGGPLLAGLGLPLEAVGETLARGSERYMANAQPAEIERQMMAEQSPGWGFAQDVGAQVPQLLAAAASGGGAPALAVLGASAAGQGIQQAEMAGATPEEAVIYGTTSGLIEAGTERFGKIPVVDKILKRAITGTVVKGGALKRILKDVGANFGEEVAASVGQRIAALQTYDDQGNFSAQDVSEALYSGLVGAFVAGVPSAAAEIGGRGAAPQAPPPPQIVPAEAEVPPVEAAPPPQEAPGAPVTPQAEPVPVPEVLWPPSEPQASPPPVLTVTEEPAPPPIEVVVEAPPPPTPPVQPEPVAQPVPAVPQEAQDAQAEQVGGNDQPQAAQADVAQPRQAAADAAPVAPEAVAQEAVLTGEESQDAVRRQEGRQEGREGREEVTPQEPPVAAAPEAPPAPKPKAERWKVDAYKERPSMDPETGAEGPIRTEWRVRPTPQEVKEDFFKRQRTPGSYILEERTIKRGEDLGWEVVDTADRSTTLLDQIDQDALPASDRFKKRSEANRSERQKKQAEEEKRRAEEEGRRSRQEARARGDKAFQRMKENPKHADTIAAWDAMHEHSRTEEGKPFIVALAQDEDFKAKYAQAFTEHRIPQKAKAYREITAEYNAKFEAWKKAEGAAQPKASEAEAKKPGEKGMAATAAVPYMQIPTATAPPRTAAQKPLGTQGVVSGLSRLWDIPVRFRHFRKRAQAIFKVRPEVVRMREAGDLPAAAHEIAHYIDKTRPTLVTGAHKAAADELVALGKRLYNKGTHNRAFYESEGFAEYMRHRLTRDDAAQQAPEFDSYFNGAVAGDAELTQKLSESRALYDQWRGQAPIERAKGQIDFDQELGKLPAKERAAEVGRKTVSGMIDSWKPLDTFTNEMLERANRKREDLPAAADPYRLLAAFQGSESSIARQMMLHGVRDAEGTIIAAPVKEVMSKVKAEDYRDFFAYTLAKRTIELEAKGKETGLSVDDAREIIAAHENADWEAAAKGLNAYANGLVDILLGAGALTQSQADKIKESEWYIPLTRVYEAESGGRLTSDYAGKKKQTAGGGEQPIQKLKGSTRPIQDPMLSLAQLTERVISAATRAKVFRAVYGLQDAVEGAGDIVEEVDAPKIPASFTLDKIRKQLEDMGIDVPTDADGDALLTIFSSSAFPTGSDPIVTGVVNGQRKFLYVKDPLLYQSLAHMPPPWLEATRLLWPLRKMASAVRLGATGLNPGFGLITNFIRDAWTGTLQTLTNPGSFVIRMARSAGRDTAADKLFYAGGGEMATPLGVDIKPFRKLKREIAAQTTMDEALLKARHPIDSLRDLIAFTETFGRRAEFRRVYDETLKKTGDKESAWVAAQEAASEVTVNFRRAGIYGRALNQIIPFFNVAIQGPRAGVKAFQRNPTKAFLTATASLTVPALALYALHRDDEWYQEVPAWEKAIFLHFKVGNQVIRLPLPFEWGILFATLPVAALDRLRTDDQQRFEESYGAMLDSLLPDTLPAGVRQAYEWAANVNLLTGRSIESERLERLLPEDRFYASTSEVYKKIGKMLGLSPVKLQNTAEGLTGGLSRTFTDPFKGKKAREAADIPVVGRLFSRQLRTGQSVTDIYNESERAEQVYASILKALEEGDQNEIDRLEKKYDDLLGVNPEGELKKGATRERYRRLYLLRDAKKLLKEAKGLDDPKVATRLARIMLGRDKLEDLPEAERKLLEEAFDIPEPEDDED